MSLLEPAYEQVEGRYLAAPRVCIQPRSALSLSLGGWRAETLARPARRQQGQDTRYIDIHEGNELDEAQMATSVKQAAALPGFLGPRP